MISHSLQTGFSYLTCLWVSLALTPLVSSGSDFLAIYLPSTLVHQREKLQLSSVSPGPLSACDAFCSSFRTQASAFLAPTLSPPQAPHTCFLAAGTRPFYSVLLCCLLAVFFLSGWNVSPRGAYAVIS